MRLVSYANHVPTYRLGVEECVEAAGQPKSEAKAFVRIFGIERVPALPDDEQLADVFSEVLDRLANVTSEPMEQPDVLIYVHACPLSAEMGSEVIKKLTRSHPFLRKADQVYEMDQNCCATLFWALNVSRNMLRKRTARRIAILAGDSFSAYPLSERYMPACTVLGDAFTGLLLDDRDDGVQIDDIVLKCNPKFHHGLYGSAVEVSAFNRAHIHLLEDILVDLKFQPKADEPILPHNINSFSWDQYCVLTDTKRESVWLNMLSDFGHCCSTDSFLNLDRFFDSEDYPSAVLVGAGQGGFVGGCRVRKPNSGGLNGTG